MGTLLGCAPPPSPAPVPTPLTTVILVRHAEKADDSRDPPLSAAGVARAEALVRTLHDQPLDAVYVTPFIRTRETGRGVAEARGIPLREQAASATYAADLAALLRERHAGQTVLVVGHSNTTPALLGALGVADPPAIADGEYDGLFVVTVGGVGPARLVRLRYGAPSGDVPL